MTVTSERIWERIEKNRRTAEALRDMLRQCSAWSLPLPEIETDHCYEWHNEDRTVRLHVKHWPCMEALRGSVPVVFTEPYTETGDRFKTYMEWLDGKLTDLQLDEGNEKE